MTDTDLILYDVKGCIATITINRPDKANACNVSMLKSIYEGLVNADEDEKVKCILIKSSGRKFFSAGYDLKEATGDPKKALQIQEWEEKSTKPL